MTNANFPSSEAYEQGRLARREGKENIDNPYSDLVFEELFDSWADGYWDQHAELTKQRSDCAG